jgi:4-amino-4-deoxy-L-arabinose transferase-like glycosyltransferase
MRIDNYTDTRLDRLCILSLLLLFFLTSLPYLNIFPKTWMDEAWDSTTAYSFQNDGTFRNVTLVSPEWGNQDVHFLQPRIFSNIVTAPFFSLFGLGVVQGRLASVLAGAFAVVGTYMLARTMGSFFFASICSIFLILDNLFFVTTRTIRPEIFVTALVIWAFYLLINAGTDFKKLFTGGLLLGVSLYTHPNAALALLALLMIVFVQISWREYGRVLIPLLLGLAIGVLPYALYVLAQDGANHFRDFWLQIHQRADVLTDTRAYLKTAFVLEIERYQSYIFFPYRLLIFLIQLAALAFAFYERREKFNRAALIFVMVHILLFPVLISNKTPRYMTVLMPILVILVMRMIWSMAGWKFNNSPHEAFNSISKLSRSTVIPLGLALILFANQAAGNAWAMWQSRQCDFPTLAEQMRVIVPADSKVWGPMTFWLIFYDYHYRTQITIKDDETMREFQPDYVVIGDSEIWGNQKGVTKRVDPYYAKLEPVRIMLTRLVAERGRLAGSISNNCYGDIEIYKLQWP